MYSNDVINAAPQFRLRHDRPEQPNRVRRSPVLSRRELRRIVAEIIG